MVWQEESEGTRLASSVSRSKSDRIHMGWSSKASMRKRKSAELSQTIKSGSKGRMEQSAGRNCEYADSKCSQRLAEVKNKRERLQNIDITVVRLDL